MNSLFALEANQRTLSVTINNMIPASTEGIVRVEQECGMQETDMTPPTQPDESDRNTTTICKVCGRDTNGMPFHTCLKPSEQDSDVKLTEDLLCYCNSPGRKSRYI